VAPGSHNPLQYYNAGFTEVKLRLNPLQTRYKSGTRAVSDVMRIAYCVLRETARVDKV